METKEQKAARLAAEALAKASNGIVTETITDDGDETIIDDEKVIITSDPKVNVSLLEDRLIVGQCAITRMRIANGEKIELEFAELVIPSYRSTNIISLLNQGDSRFSSAKIKSRKAYICVEPEMAKILGVKNIDSIDPIDSDWIRVDIMSPSLIDPNTGKKLYLGIQVTESYIPSEYQASDVVANCKQSPEGEPIICSETGNYIFVQYSIEDRNIIKHTWIKGVLASRYA